MKQAGLKSVRINTANPTIIHPNGVIGILTTRFAVSGMTQDGMKNGVSGAIQFAGNTMVTGRRRI
jgi:hypothetical protein